MVLVGLKIKILNQLCSADQLELLDVVDGLRSQGIDSCVFAADHRVRRPVLGEELCT
jgi:hypothetical protein